jgi:hypothetical protein
MAASKKSQADYKKALESMHEICKWYDMKAELEPKFAPNDDRNSDYIKWVAVKKYQKKADRPEFWQVRECETSIELTYCLADGDLDFYVKARTANWEFINVTIDQKCFGIPRQIENIFRAVNWHSEIGVDQMIRGIEIEYDKKNKKAELETV